MQLFDDQLAVLEDVRQAYREGARAPLLAAPTGFGKTVLFSYITAEAERRGKSTTIIVHRQELIDQVSDTLKEFGVRHGIISPHYAPTSRCKVQVASVFSLVRRVAQLATPDLAVIDEAHHAVPGSTWGKVLDAFHGTRVLGVTATPVRLSGQGLSHCFDRLILGPSTQALIDKGRLAPVRVFAPPTIDITGVHTRMGDYVSSELAARADQPKVTGDAIEHYRTITPGERAAVFCVSLEHCEHITQTARSAGIEAVRIDGHMERRVRRQIVQEFKDGKIQWLVSCDLISEGFDCPGIEVGISLRPTQSLGLWLQQCGRILRTSPGKHSATILDHAGNTLRHGLPTEVRHWDLSGTAANASKGRGVSVRVCPKCFAAQRSGVGACLSCGHTFAVESRTVASEAGQLKEISQAQIDAHRAARERQTQGQQKTLEGLIALGRMRKYKDPEAWARYVMAGRQKKRASA